MRDSVCKSAFMFFEILDDRILDTRVLDLHHDVVAARQHRAMHLTERRRGKGVRLEALEELLRRRTELACDLGADHVVRHRRHRRLHGGEDLERLGRQQVAAHAEHLRQLHERALELGRALDDAHGVPDVGVEQIAIGALLRLEWTLQRLPDVAAAERGSEGADLEDAAGAPGRQAALTARQRTGFRRARAAVAARGSRAGAAFGGRLARGGSFARPEPAVDAPARCSRAATPPRPRADAPCRSGGGRFPDVLIVRTPRRAPATEGVR